MIKSHPASESLKIPAGVKLINVSVGLLVNQEGKVLITQRPSHVSYGNFWEFPGGKIETGETAEMALLREIQEELNVSVMSYGYIGFVRHQTPEFLINLYGFCVKHFEGIPLPQTLQLDLRWVEFKELSNYSFPEATVQLISRYLNR